jgi:hypothetical protein
MVAPLFAANDLGSFVIIAIAALVSLISAAVKNRNQQIQAERARPKNRQQPEGQQEPAKELERFLNELTDQRKKNQKPQPQPARRPTQDSRTQQRKPKPIKQQAPTPVRPIREPESPRTSQVLHRHLSSALEQRHQESMHSELEKKHLRSDVSSRHLSAIESQVDSGSTKFRPDRGDMTITDLIPQDRNDFTRAFIFSQIFGPPAGLQ